MQKKLDNQSARAYIYLTRGSHRREEGEMTVWVVEWRYIDGSDGGTVMVFAEQDKAEDLVRLLTEHSGTRSFRAVEVAYDGE